MSRIALATFVTDLNTLLTDINTLLADNTNNEISEEDVRDVLIEIKDILVDVKDSFAHLDVTDLKKDLADTQRAALGIKFDKDTINGDPTTPLTGNITLDTTDAKLGAQALIVHNSGSAPTFSSPYQLVHGAYATGVDNFIECTYLRTNKVIYKIYQ